MPLSNTPLSTHIREKYRLSTQSTGDELTISQVHIGVNLTLKKYYNIAEVETELAAYAAEKEMIPTNCYIYLKNK